MKNLQKNMLKKAGLALAGGVATKFVEKGVEYVLTKVSPTLVGNKYYQYIKSGIVLSTGVLPIVFADKIPKEYRDEILSLASGIVVVGGQLFLKTAVPQLNGLGYTEPEQNTAPTRYIPSVRPVMLEQQTPVTQSAEVQYMM